MTTSEKAAGRNRSARSRRTVPGPRAQTCHHLPAEEVLRLLEVGVMTGLSAAAVQDRREKFGPNQVITHHGPAAWRRFLLQFNQPLIYVLLLAGGAAALLGEWVDSLVIGGVVLTNALVGFLQETKAEQAIGSLARLVLSETTVRREGRQQRIPSSELVPGDVVLLQPGDEVPADLRLFHTRALQVDESALTGESVPVHKHPDALATDTLLADRGNVAFAGTIVTAGHGEGVVWATGDRTEAGHIAWLISGAVEMQTPLTRKIAEFSRLLLQAILVLAVITFAIGVARGEKPSEMFMASVALAVGAIPEGLSAAITIVLAIGVSRMAKRQAIIRKLPAVETLGSTTVICSDKTGTLTENQMTVREVFAGGNSYGVTGAGYQPEGEIQLLGQSIELDGHPALTECLRAGLLCNDSLITRGENRHLQVQGDPTEAALLVAAGKGGLIHADTQRASPRLDMIPFAAEHMFRATLHARQTGQVIYKVGAVERLLDNCVDTLDGRGEPAPLDRRAVLQAAGQMAASGLRVLAFARRHLHAKPARLEPAHVTGGLTFLGLQGMIDPPRPEVGAAVRQCQQAGIAVKLITGDHPVTARALASQVGLKGREADGKLVVLSGRELEKLSDLELPEIAHQTAVFARVDPAQKLRLVRALQTRGHVVAMTGDGVNDAPALKQADIGVAMGRGGTDVAKGAAAMLLTDDNFASIVAAVEEGRSVFDNITKFIVWILPTNLGEALLLVTSIGLGLPLPVLPLQLLWINLTDTLLGLPLAFEPREENVMSRPPRHPRQPLLTFSLLMRSGLVSFLMLAGGLWLFGWERSRAGADLAAARTSVVNLIMVVETAYLFNCRSLSRSCFATGFFSNRPAVAGALLMLAAQLLFTYVPLMNRLFHSAPIGSGSWLRIGLIAAAVFGIVELEKWLRYGRGRGAHALPE
jgi:cation-transporting ATPase F